nr:hypothetical protein [Tanacetum cinerariifolium]
LHQQGQGARQRPQYRRPEGVFPRGPGGRGRRPGEGQLPRQHLAPGGAPLCAKHHEGLPHPRKRGQRRAARHRAVPGAAGELLR